MQSTGSGGIDYVGLPEKELPAHRVVERDGEVYAITMDYDPTRLNVVLVNGVVTRWFMG